MTIIKNELVKINVKTCKYISYLQNREENDDYYAKQNPRINKKQAKLFFSKTNNR